MRYLEINNRIQMIAKNFGGHSRSRPYYYHFHNHDGYDFALNMTDMYQYRFQT
jgi:hypothetical protein